MYPRDIAEFEAKLLQPFNNKALLQQAFIHRSYINEAEDGTEWEDNERLEFLGDAVLGFVISELLYREYPDFQEGDLTSLRSTLVRQAMLSELALEWQMGEFLWLGHGEESSGGRVRPVTLCATFEAVIGALFLDQDMDAVTALLLKMFEGKWEQRQKPTKDAKSRLQEWIQGTVGKPPRYKVVDQDGPDHATLFTIQVNIDSIACGVGKGLSKQLASQAAAAMALHFLGEEAPEYEENPELIAEWPINELSLDELIKQGVIHKKE